MSIRYTALAILVAAASVVAVTAHAYGIQSPAAAAPVEHRVISRMCEGVSGAAGTSDSDHHAQMAAALGLSPDQRANIDRIAGEACAAMAKYHDEILAQLTPEQRSSLHKLHPDSRDLSFIHRLMRKLHGG
jgi:Spy/CpxP family protein refolding chaperone